MVGLIIVVLIICALITVIWGRQAGQKAFGCISVPIVIVIVIVGGTILGFIGWIDATMPRPTAKDYAAPQNAGTWSPDSQPSSAPTTAVPTYTSPTSVPQANTETAPTEPQTGTVPTPAASSGTMPNLCGMNVREARSAISSDNLILDQVSENNTQHPVRPHGFVMDQYPPADSPISPGTHVRLDVASGKTSAD